MKSYLRLSCYECGKLLCVTDNHITNDEYFCNVDCASSFGINNNECYESNIGAPISGGVVEGNIVEVCLPYDNAKMNTQHIEKCCAFNEETRG